MRIGILTYHRSHNYGALLQAIALRLKLVSYGHEVFYVDYWPDYHKHLYSLFSIKVLVELSNRQKLKYIYNSIFNRKKIKARINVFNGFISYNILPYCISYSETTKLDAIVYGSDQIWRKQPEWHTFNAVYFGINIINAPLNISYAASTGDVLFSENDDLKIKGYLKKLNKISVREESLKKKLNSLGYSSVEKHVDPTMLLSKERWEDILGSHRPVNFNYLLFYDFQPGVINEQSVINFAKRKNLKVIYIYASNKIIKEDEFHKSNIDPYEFANLIRFSDFVITSSFHGLIFSAIFEKEFYTSMLYNVERVKDFLKTANLEDRFITPKISVIPDVLKKIDYNIVNSKFVETLNSSERYLKNISSL